MTAKIEWYREVLELEPNSKVFFPLARLEAEQGEIQEAIVLLENGLKRHPEFLEARLYLIELLYQTQRTEECNAEIARLSKMFASYAGFWKAWAACLASEQGNEDTASLLRFLAAHFVSGPLHLHEVLNRGLDAMLKEGGNIATKLEAAQSVTSDGDKALKAQQVAETPLDSFANNADAMLEELDTALASESGPQEAAEESLESVAADMSEEEMAAEAIGGPELELPEPAADEDILPAVEEPVMAEIEEPAVAMVEPQEAEGLETVAAGISEEEMTAEAIDGTELELPETAPDEDILPAVEEPVMAEIEEPAVAMVEPQEAEGLETVAAGISEEEMTAEAIDGTELELPETAPDEDILPAVEEPVMAEIEEPAVAMVEPQEAEGLESVAAGISEEQMAAEAIDGSELELPEPSPDEDILPAVEEPVMAEIKEPEQEAARAEAAMLDELELPEMDIAPPTSGNKASSEPVETEEEFPEEEHFSLRTRSMAEVLAEQGDIQGALDIYQELADAATSGDELEDIKRRMATLKARMNMANASSGFQAADEEQQARSKEKLIGMLEALAQRMEARAGS